MDTQLVNNIAEVSGSAGSGGTGKGAQTYDNGRAVGLVATLCAPAAPPASPPARRPARPPAAPAHAALLWPARTLLMHTFACLTRYAERRGALQSKYCFDHAIATCVAERE